MQLSASLNLKQKQSLVMTPQLQQAIRLLQMTNLDLRQYLESECSENPFFLWGKPSLVGSSGRRGAPRACAVSKRPRRGARGPAPP